MVDETTLKNSTCNFKWEKRHGCWIVTDPYFYNWGGRVLAQFEADCGGVKTTASKYVYATKVGALTHFFPSDFVLISRGDQRSLVADRHPAGNRRNFQNARLNARAPLRRGVGSKIQTVGIRLFEPLGKTKTIHRRAVA